MIASTKTDTTLFKYIVKKVEAEKSELLSNINREITRKRDCWHKNPSVYVLYRIQSDKLYTEYWGKTSIAQELHFLPTTDMLVLQIPAKNHKVLSIKQFEEMLNEQFSRINKILLSGESMKIPDKISSVYFDDEKFNADYANATQPLYDIGNSLVTYQVSIFDVDSKIAILSLILWLDENFYCFDDVKDIVKPLLSQMQLICLHSFNEWSIEFVKSLSSILHSEFNELLGLKNDFVDDVCNIETLLDNALNLKKAEAAIQTETQN